MAEVQYELAFEREALDEWQKLDGSVKQALKTQLAKRLVQPHIPGDRLRTPLTNCYKIKLRKQGYRLIYRVDDTRIIVVVIAVGRRDKNAVYEAAIKRLAAR